MHVTFAEFATEYQRAVGDVLGHWNVDMQVEISRHNLGWHPSQYQFDQYLVASVDRYYRAYVNGVRSHQSTICDVGGFWGVFPLTLHRLGHEVAMTEALKYYSASFDALFDFIRAAGVHVVDYDPFEPSQRLPGSYDTVFVMAVLEHYPHSLRTFMQNVVAGLAPNGILYIEVPNIAYWPKRVALLRGESPNPRLRDIFESRIPFTGHHHEFTQRELLELAELSGLRVVHSSAYNYSTSANWKARARFPVQTAALRWMPTARELLAIACTREDVDANGAQ